jgi:hypothetical protein
MNDPQVPIRVNLPIPQIIPHRRGKHLHLFNRPAQRARKQRKTHALGAPNEILVDPLAQLLVALVLGPRVNGPFGGRGHDVDEARAVHHVGHMGNGVEREAGFVGAFLHVLVPAVEGGVGGQRVVVAPQDEVDVVDFEVAVWLEKGEALIDKARPVLVGTSHHLRVDVVEFPGKGPVLFEVVDFEV